jgi:hypothetical protein
MATTTPKSFEGEPDLTPEKVAVITEWYHIRLADSDKADHDDALYWSGCADALADVLGLLHNVAEDEPDWQDRVPAGAPEADRVSPANEKETHVMEQFEHEAGAAFAEVHAHFTRPELRDGRGYTLLPRSGWYLYDGPRLVLLQWWSITGEEIQHRQVEHAELLRDVSNLMDTLAVESTTSPEYLMAAAAFDLILSDAQTGTSLFSWEPMRRLVNHVITSIYCAEGITITTAWQEF